MYQGIKKIEEVIDYIETNITSDIDCKILANKMNLSVYEFRRIFSFIVGCPISEYIRKRRLSLAACELMSGNSVNMLALSQKYGYTSQSAFIKAFGEQHGVAPTICQKGNCEIHLFTRPRFQLNINNGEMISFRIIESASFYIQGWHGISAITDSCCCEDVWKNFYENQIDKKLLDFGCDGEIYVSYHDQNDNVDCTIGSKMKQEDECCTGLSLTKVPQSRFACFKVYTVDDDVINEVYSKILYDWLPSANIKRRENMPTIERFPFDMSVDGFEWEIWIPIQ